MNHDKLQFKPTFNRKLIKHSNWVVCLLSFQSAAIQGKNMIYFFYFSCLFDRDST